MTDHTKQMIARTVANNASELQLTISRLIGGEELPEPLAAELRQRVLTCGRNLNNMARFVFDVARPFPDMTETEK